MPTPTTPAVRDSAEPDRLQAALDTLPAPLEPPDVAMLDGYLCGVLLQPRRVPEARWLPACFDVNGRALPTGIDVEAVTAPVRHRHAELERAIAGRQWFDPWVYEPDEAATPADAVMPWVAGFALAMELFPALMDDDSPALTEPLALLFQYLDPDDLEDAEALLAEIETLEPPNTLPEAVEDLVRAVLLIADVTRPHKPLPGARRAAPARPRRGPRR